MAVLRRNKHWVLLILAASLLLATTTLMWAKRPGPPGPGKCPNPYIFCLDVWDPVVCDDGKVYSNQCYADRACATGCEPTGGGPTM